jgi:hypothetical protein
MRRNIMGTENYEEREDDHGHDGDKDHDHDHDHDHDKCWKIKKERDEYKKERDEYKKERDEYKAYLRAALERLGVAVHKLAHLLDDLVDGSKKIGKDHGKGDDKDDD